MLAIQGSSDWSLIVSQLIRQGSVCVIILSELVVTISYSHDSSDKKMQMHSQVVWHSEPKPTIYFRNLRRSPFLLAAFACSAVSFSLLSETLIPTVSGLAKRRYEVPEGRTHV